MFQKRLLVLLLLLFSFSKTFSQKMELGKVSIAELEEKAHPKDPSAAAAILFRTGVSRFEYDTNEGFMVVTTVQTRIKIYKKEGYEWATEKIWYIMNNSIKEKVSFSDAATYNLVDGKIVKSKLKSDGEFDEKIDRNYGQKKITMPAVKEGSVVEFEYEIKSPITDRIREWAFQTSIPVNYSSFETRIPEYYVFNKNQKGSLVPKVTTDRTTRSIVFSNKERTEGHVVTTSFSTDKVEYEETQTKYVMENLPAMNEEDFVNNIDNYTASIAHELSLTKFPRVPYKTYATDWTAVTKTIYNDDDFGKELNKTGYFENDIKSFVSESKTQDELIGKIFDYVKASVKWNSKNSYYCYDGVKTAYKNKTGNVAEINLMLTAMLRFAGVNANPVLISTRANGIAFFPNRTAFNYVISGVETPQGIVLLDATEKYAVPNILPLRDLNWIGRLIRKDGTSAEVDLIPKAISKEVTFMNFAVSPAGVVEGKIRNQFTDQRALDFRGKYNAVNNDSYLETLENKNNNIEITDYLRENETDFSKPIIEKYSFKDSKTTEIINDKIYISPLLFLTAKENPFKQDKREYPVDFGYPNETRYNIGIDIPEGYRVESMPKPFNLSTGDEVGTFKYNIAATGNKVQITIVSDITQAIVPSDYYNTIKEFFQKMIEQQNEKIVLIKA